MALPSFPNAVTIEAAYPGDSTDILVWCREHIGPSVHAIGGGNWVLNSVPWLDADDRTRVQLRFEFENPSDATMFTLRWIH